MNMTASRIIAVQGFGACTEALSVMVEGRKALCLVDPAVSGRLELPPRCHVMAMPKGEEGKNLSTAQAVWSRLIEEEMVRQDVLVTIGGGATSDIGGFAASTYKRGMRLIHIPTTILGAVDAAIGGKTAIDYGGLKNMIGTFYPPEAVIVSVDFFDTLPREEVLSGWGEILKYSLLSDSCTLSENDQKRMKEGQAPSGECVARCMSYKVEVTAEDPTDRGRRQVLNLGHTMGHALEALMIEEKTPVPHGIAVAAGIVMELYLSLMKVSFPQAKMMQVARSVKGCFPPLRFGCKQYDRIRALARQDKKNIGSETMCILLSDTGSPLLPQAVSGSEMDEAMDFYRDFMGV